MLTLLVDGFHRCSWYSSRQLEEAPVQNRRRCCLSRLLLDLAGVRREALAVGLVLRRAQAWWLAEVLDQHRYLDYLIATAYLRVRRVQLCEES